MGVKSWDLRKQFYIIFDLVSFDLV